VIAPVYDPPAVTAETVLQAAIQVLARGSDPEATVRDLLELARGAAGADGAAAMLWDAERAALAVAAAVGLDQDAVSRLAGAATDANDPVHRAAYDRVRVLDDESTPGRAASAWPIVVASGAVEEPLGAVAVIGRRDASLDPDGATVAAIADLIGVAVDRARATSEVGEHADWQERVANSDALTGLANARTLSRVLELELARAARQDSEVSLAVFDIDGLSTINRDAGRAVGDDVLREVAAVAAESVRFVDTLARWGGDEFMLVAPGATGTTVVRRIVEKIGTRPPIGGRAYTVSAGLARFPMNGTTAEALVGAATSALAAAQAAGGATLAEAVHEGKTATESGTSAEVAAPAPR
jgi:diguanylate cyclase (GGDEF)-like protein